MEGTAFAASLEKTFDLSPQPQDSSSAESSEAAASRTKEIEIVNACIRGDFEECKVYLARYEEVQPDYKTLDKSTAWLMLCLAVTLKRHLTVDKLLNSAFAHDHDLKSADLLHELFAHGDLDILRSLHTHDLSLFKHDYYSGLNKAPSIACRSCKDSSMISYMLDHNVDVRPERFSQPLRDAIRNGLSLPIIEKLVVKGALRGQSDLNTAVEYKRLDVLEFLLSHAYYSPCKQLLEKAYETKNRSIIDAIQRRNRIWLIETLGGLCSGIRNLRANRERQATVRKHNNNLR